MIAGPAGLFGTEAALANCPQSRRCSGKCCPNHAHCRHGKCRCRKGFTKCGKHCRNLETDVKNCGSCGHKCPSGKVCHSGHCKPGAECQSAGDCPQAGAGSCQQAVCDNGACGFASDDSNLPIDGNQCTQDLCTGGVPSNPPELVSTSCNQTGGTHCDGAGNCVAATCIDGLENGDETDVDCGGSCSPCANGKSCLGNSDCASGLCSGGTCIACASNPDCGGTGSVLCSEHVCSSGVCQTRATDGDSCGVTGTGCPPNQFRDLCCANGTCTMNCGVCTS